MGFCALLERAENHFKSASGAKMASTAPSPTWRPKTALSLPKVDACACERSWHLAYLGPLYCECNRVAVWITLTRWERMSPRLMQHTKLGDGTWYLQELVPNLVLESSHQHAIQFRGAAVAAAAQQQPHQLRQHHQQPQPQPQQQPKKNKTWQTCNTLNIHFLETNIHSWYPFIICWILPPSYTLLLPHIDCCFSFKEQGKHLQYK